MSAERKWKRALPWVGGDPTKLVEVPGVARFVAQSVGNTSHTTGLDFYVHLDGEEEAERGYARFYVVITEDARIEWRRVPFRSGSWHQEDFAPEIVEHMQHIAEATPDRDPVGYIFHVMGAVDIELIKHRREIADMERSIGWYTEWLADPKAPQDYPKLILTDEERAARRAGWAIRLPRTRTRLQAYHKAHDARIATLKRVSKAVTEWCSRKRMPRRPVVEIVEEALAG